jgi:translocator protein
MTRLSIIRQVIGLAGWILLSLAAAGVGAVASVRANIFYQQLSRPEWAPPAWIFGPMWSVLYLLMAIAAWIVWRQRGFRESAMALLLFIAQLTANAVWSWCFFPGITERGPFMRFLFSGFYYYAPSPRSGVCGAWLVFCCCLIWHG